MALAEKPRRPDSPEQSVSSLFLPSLLTGIAETDEATSRTAGYGLALVTRAHPETASQVASELIGRLASDSSNETLRRTLASVREVDDEAIRDALRDNVGGEYARELYGAIDKSEPWDLEDRLAGDDAEAFLTEFRRLVRLDDDERPPPDETDVIDARGLPGEDDDPDEEYEPDPSAAKAHTNTPREIVTQRERIERAAQSDAFQTIAFRSAFDDLTVVSPPTDRRYGKELRARGTIEDTERGIALRLLEVPADRSGFDAAISERLLAWTRLAGRDGVVTVVDWGDSPRPWVATEYIEDRLATRGRPDPRRGLRETRALAATLVRVHQHDVAHGAIDPKNVVYPADSMGGGRPMFDNVGLIGTYRRQFNPADFLDPRYAAPEYFDSQYGGFDHATDIYQLGMVCYRLCTGRHPFDGPYESVRESVLDDRPSPPTEVAPELPSALDEIVAKATAKGKLTRYETANDFYQDLTRLCGAVSD